jgi:uncharacterized membrane protein
MKYKSVLKYISLFFLFSFIGLILESLFYFIFGNNLRLYDYTVYLLLGIKIPFILIYGLVGLILFKLQKLRINFILRGLINGLVIILSEFIIGFISLVLFNYRAWNYSNQINLFGVISLEMSIVWIILGIVFSFIYKLVRER